MNKFFIILFITFSIMLSCNSINKEKQVSNNQNDGLIADSIIYDVVISAIDKEDPWEEERLKSFNQELFIEQIFNGLYNGIYTAYDYQTHSKLSIKKIKEKLDSPGFDRSKISKVQFNEQWTIDSTGTLIKKINSLTLGIESYSKQGTFLGHDALFIVKLEPTDR